MAHVDRAIGGATVSSPDSKDDFWHFI